MPVICCRNGSVIFEFDNTSGKQGLRLVIRCDDNGEVMAKIVDAVRD